MPRIGVIAGSIHRQGVIQLADRSDPMRGEIVVDDDTGSIMPIEPMSVKP